MAIVLRGADRPGEVPGGARVRHAFAPYHSEFHERVTRVLAAGRRARWQRVQQEAAALRADLAEAVEVAEAAGLLSEARALCLLLGVVAEAFYALATAAPAPRSTCTPTLLTRVVPAHGPPTGPAPVQSFAGVLG